MVKRVREGRLKGGCSHDWLPHKCAKRLVVNGFTIAVLLEEIGSLNRLFSWLLPAMSRRAGIAGSRP